MLNYAPCKNELQKLQIEAAAHRDAFAKRENKRAKRRIFSPFTVKKTVLKPRTKKSKFA